MRNRNGWFCHFSLRCAKFFLLFANIHIHTDSSEWTIYYRLETLLLARYTKIQTGPFISQCDDGLFIVLEERRATEKNCSISSLCGSSCHGIGYVFIARVCSNVNSICFIGIFFLLGVYIFFSLLELTILWTKTNNNFVNVLYSFVQLGSNEFPQKNKGFFLLSWSIIKLEKNHWDCSGYKRTKWIYKNQHFTSWNKLLITNFSHCANKNLCIYWKKEWIFHVFFSTCLPRTKS